MVTLESYVRYFGIKKWVPSLPSFSLWYPFFFLEPRIGYWGRRRQDKFVADSSCGTRNGGTDRWRRCRWGWVDGRRYAFADKTKTGAWWRRWTCSFSSLESIPHWHYLRYSKANEPDIDWSSFITSGPFWEWSKSIFDVLCHVWRHKLPRPSGYLQKYQKEWCKYFYQPRWRSRNEAGKWTFF